MRRAAGGDERSRLYRAARRVDPGTVLTLGDNVYYEGTAAQFAACYAPTWGRFKARTNPSPGNHDYETAAAAGYFDYFGDRAGPDRRGYYSFNVGAWHLISLNSNVPATPGSAQDLWLRADLGANLDKRDPGQQRGAAHGGFRRCPSHASQRPLPVGLHRHRRREARCRRSTLSLTCRPSVHALRQSRDLWTAHKMERLCYKARK